MGDPREGRLIGNYILGQRIGLGSFAVVWKARHRISGLEVAVKEIDKRQLLSPTTNRNKVGENLLKEISILTNIRHPNIIRLFEAIETEERIYLVLEYCDGGDLAAYITRHGRVSEAVARHFMRQLGLQVLNENNLIHRDLKPQNLLLSSNEPIPLLKIGDFGFARYLTPQGLADTLCGSPLYMAPEIIQNKKYDGKADLWSAGAILFQLVTGKPPFDGDTQLQLFQNILTSGELRFPRGAVEELHPDCVDLCKSLLRQNPIERLIFEEFFNHKFLAEPGKYNASTSTIKGEHRNEPNDAFDRLRTSLESQASLSEQQRVSDSLDSIEKDYVLVNAHFALMETLSSSLEASMPSTSVSRVFSQNDQDIAAMKRKELGSNPVHSVTNPQINESPHLAVPSSSLMLKEVHGLPVLHPSTRLRLLHQYICVLSELSQMKNNADLFLESFSIELVVLAIWKVAIQVSSAWLSTFGMGDLQRSHSPNEAATLEGAMDLSSKSRETLDFSKPQSVCIWAERGFILALDRAEKLSDHIHDMDGNAHMPDAMDIIFHRALEVGKSGGVDELMGNENRAAASYMKAKLLLSFIVGEAASLPLNPPFSLSTADRERIKGYIVHFESRQSHLQLSPK